MKAVNNNNKSSHELEDLFVLLKKSGTLKKFEKACTVINRITSHKNIKPEDIFNLAKKIARVRSEKNLPANEVRMLQNRQMELVLKLYKMSVTDTYIPPIGELIKTCIHIPHRKEHAELTDMLIVNQKISTCNKLKTIFKLMNYAIYEQEVESND